MTLPHSSIRSYVTLPIALDPLKEKNFGFLWMGAFLSSIGFWVQAVGQAWQILQLTNSALLLGLVGFTATLPNIILALFGGVIADRFDRRRLLMATQSIFMSTAALLGILTTLHIITVWQIILMALINGTFNTVGLPAWQAFIGDLVQQEQFKQGIALNSMQFNLSRVIGPAIGGISISMFGMAGSYYLNAVSYLAVIIPLVLMRPAQKQLTSQQQSIWLGLREGFSYVRRRPALQMILRLQFVIAFLVFPYSILLPVFARDIFHVGATGLGMMNAAAGIGALTGSILLVLLCQHLKGGRGLLMTLCIIGGFMSLAFCLSHDLEISLLILVVLGSCTAMSTTISSTTLQILTPEGMRGRILSLWVMITLGMAPFGNLLAGWVAQSIGAPLTLAIGGSLCSTVAVFLGVIKKAT